MPPEAAEDFTRTSKMDERTHAVPIAYMRPKAAHTAVLAVPTTSARRLGVLRGTPLEEIGILDAIENLDEPRQRMRLELCEPIRFGLEEAENRGNPELA